MVFDPNAKKSSPDSEHTFPVQSEPLVDVLRRRISAWWLEYMPLFEAASVAVSAHILAFPLIWFIGWALPWPKSPEIMTVIEFDLSNWPEQGAVPRSITDIYESQKGGKK